MDKAEAPAGSLSFLYDNAIVNTISDGYRAFSERRKALNLTQPGTVENIAKEIQKDVLCTNFFFQGLRAELQKIFSATPLFQIQHSFQMGPSVQAPYNFMAVYGTSNVSHAPYLLDDYKFLDVLIFPSYRFSYKPLCQMTVPRAVLQTIDGRPVWSPKPRRSYKQVNHWYT